MEIRRRFVTNVLGALITLCGTLIWSLLIGNLVKPCNVSPAYTHKQSAPKLFFTIDLRAIQI